MELSYRGSGSVELEAQKRECHLYMNEDNGGVLLEIVINDAFSSTLELPDIITELKVELSNGARFILLDAYRSKGVSSNVSYGTSIFSYGAKYYITGFANIEHFRNEFKSVFFEISGVMRWGGKLAYSIEKDYSVKNNYNDETLIYENDEVKIKYHVKGTMLPVHEMELFKDKIELNQRTLLEIEFIHETTLDSFFNMFDKIKRLIELTLIEKIVVHKIQGYSDLEFDVYNGDKFPRTLDIISPIIISKRMESNYYGTHLLKIFQLKDLLENNSVQNYFNSYEMLKPVIELYIELLYTKSISPVRLFLNIVQALETYHSRFKANTMEEFKKRVKTLTYGRTDDLEKFLIAKSKNFITLESRIADLLIADYQIYIDTGDINHFDFPNVIASTRNYYIHYDESIKKRSRVLTEEELITYNICLLIILDYYIYSELGFSNHQKLKEKLVDRWGNISIKLSIKKAFEERQP